MKFSYMLCLTMLFFLMSSVNANAYLGPGLGAGTIGAILGVIGSVFLAIFAVVYYPIKRFLKKRGLIRDKKKSDPEGEGGEQGQNSGSKE